MSMKGHSWNFTDLVKEMLDRGLIDIAKNDVHKARRLFEKMTDLNYTAQQDSPDVFTAFLRINRRN